MPRIASLVAGIVACAALPVLAAPLPALRIDPAEVTVSGLSSGGFMAVQMHVAYSATFARGAGIVAGGPYDCAQNSILNATGRCMAHTGAIPVAGLVTTTRNRAASGDVDPVANLQSSKVYLFSGTADGTVRPAVMDDLLAYYRNFVPADRIVYRDDVAAGHAMITDDYGSACATTGSPWINDCNLDLAGTMLAHLYGPLNARNSGTLGGRLLAFDQREFVTGHGMATTGWAYIPAACDTGATCRLHVVLHGCHQNTAELGQQYVRSTGYNRWADTNRIVVLYPQTGSAAINGCWDWWGYDSADYAKKRGPQMAAVKAMVDRLGSGVPTGGLPAPTGVGTSNAADTAMTIGWNAVDGANGYHVYRQGVKVNAAALTATSYRDTGLAPGTTYAWTVRAVDAGGLAGAESAPATGTTTGAAAACFTASNYAHTSAGRATQRAGIAYANGSGQNMGLWNVFVITTLRRTAPNYYVIGSCP